MPESKKQRAARERNHLILRLRGAAGVFGAARYQRNEPGVRNAAALGLQAIDSILAAMGAETEADRKARMQKEHLDA